MVFNSAVPLFESFSTTLSSVEESTKAQDQEVIQAPDFTLNDQLGESHTLSQYEGKVVFLTFFATWCQNCDRELPTIQKLYQQYGMNEDKLVMISIASPNVGQEGDEQWVKDYIEAAGYTFPVLMDDGGRVAAHYGIRAVPSTLVINQEGTLLYYIPGAIGEDAMEKLIQGVLAE